MYSTDKVSFGIIIVTSKNQTECRLLNYYVFAIFLRNTITILSLILLSFLRIFLLKNSKQSNVSGTKFIFLFSFLLMYPYDCVTTVCSFFFFQERYFISIINKTWVQNNVHKGERERETISN